MESTPAQSLLYQLRSPTLALEKKLELAQSTLISHPSLLLSQLIRDWILLDLFLRTKDVTVIVNVGWWNLLSQVVIGGNNSSTSNSTSTLPIFVSFLTAYSTLPLANNELVLAVLTVWNKLSSSSMRKATVDSILESYTILLKTSVKVISRSGNDLNNWESLCEIWLNSFRNVIDSGKNGKKIPLHTLSNLNYILPLLSILSNKSKFYLSLLKTIQFSLFNIDNLRRGIARESYNNSGNSDLKIESSNTLTTEAAEGELFNALSTCLKNQSINESQVLYSLPLLFNLYRTSLSQHSTSLFPLPIRSNFPTASAARSALEIHSLQKLRGLAAGWIKGISTLMNWSEVSSKSNSLKATALWKTLQEVEIGDLFRTGLNSGWELVLENLTQGALFRLNSSTTPEDREPLLALIASVLRLNFEAVESFLPSLLLTLASTPSVISSSTVSHPSPALSSLLDSLLIHHTRSLLIPSLLSLLSTALSNDSKVPNSLIDLEGSWREGLGKSITSLGSRTAGEYAEVLVQSLRQSLEEGKSAEETKDGEREGKRRKKDAGKVERISSTKVNKAATGRIQILHLFLRYIPSPLPLDLFNSIHSIIISPFLATSSSDIALTRSILGLRYAIFERMAEEGDADKALVESDNISEKLLSLVKDGEDEVVLDAVRNLLQILEIRDSTPTDSSKILSTILSKMTTSDYSSIWDGHLQGINSSSLPTALWEMIARRWLNIFERFGEKEHLEGLANLLVECIASTEVSSINGITSQSITARLLRRADFYEMRKIQAQVQIALLAQINITSLTSPTEVLTSLSASKLPKSLRSLSSTSILNSISLYSQINSFIPLEYLSKSLRNDLIDRALSLDIWISSGKVSDNVLSLESVELIKAQEVLRKFVLVALPIGGVIGNGAAIIENLLEHTSNYSKITVDLYRHFVKSAIASYKSDKNITTLKSYIDAFDKPLSELAKRSKKGIPTLTSSEFAFFSLCDTFVSSLGSFSSLTEDLKLFIATLIKSASKSFAKVMTLATTTLQTNPELVQDSSETINACRSFWGMKDWFTTKGEEDNYSELYSNYSQTVLSTLLSTVLKNSTVTSPKACLATLELLNFRMVRLRSLSDSNKISTLPFETFIACHVTFRPLLTLFPKAIESLNESLKRATVATTLKEYSAALQDVSGLVASAAGPVSDTSVPMEPALEVALGLLRDGPEGSSKLSSTCLSDLVRHISLYLVDQTYSTGASTAQSFLVVAKFIEGVCGDRPMLLSRQNVSSILSLVSRMLDPPSTASTSIEEPTLPTPASLTSSLFLSLVSIVSHLIRHRKDHITPLFPHLVSTLTSFLSTLRRAGFGTTGSSTLSSTSISTSTNGNNTIEENLEIGISLGKRAEREVKLTFSFWVWEGGILGIGKLEAKAVGRLLAGLTSKTTERTKKRKVTNNIGEGIETSLNPLTTTSLSAPLSKHAPFIILPYLRACVHIISPIPSSLRIELNGGWFELMDVMGKWEREALMKGFLKEEEEAERGVLRGMWRSWEKERYRG